MAIFVLFLIIGVKLLAFTTKCGTSYGFIIYRLYYVEICSFYVPTLLRVFIIKGC